MKPQTILYTCVIVLSAALARPGATISEGRDASPLLLIVPGFQTPESVIHDRDADVYLVSNVGAGNPGAIDHNGFISIVSPRGEIVTLKWIADGVNGATLNGPKGLWIRGDALYVTDVDTLRIFDRVTGLPIRSIPFPDPFSNPLFLNDVVVADNGVAYVTDTANSAIFRVDRNDHVTVLASGPQLQTPNGILVKGERVSWVTFFGHQVLSLNPTTGVSVDATLPAVDVSAVGLPPGTLLLDGYARLRDGSTLVTSWVTGKVYRISASRREITTIAKFVSLLENPANPNGPADINVDVARHRLLVPLFNMNQ